MTRKVKIEVMTPFTIDNLPYGIISTDDNRSKRCAVAFQEFAIDLDLLYRHGFFASIPDLNFNVFANVSLFRPPFLDTSTGERGLTRCRIIGMILRFCP
jgi:fumarylacetoacetase